MSILTKEEREGIRRKHRAESIADAAVIRALLDTIDALEIERDELRKKFERTKSLSRLAPQTLTALLDRLERDERERSNAKEQE